MSNVYMNLDTAYEQVKKMMDNYGGLELETHEDLVWFMAELEQKCEFRVCDLCRCANYTTNPFKVITQMGRTVETTFNFCPVCGRDLRPDTTDIWGGKGK